jgi:hypothetical protein
MTVRASNFKRKDNDLYESEPWTVEALLRVIKLDEYSVVWEPSAGNHQVVNTLKKNVKCFIKSSDIYTYNVEHDFFYDFLNEGDNSCFPRQDWIITNPPYGQGNRIAVRYAEKALERADNVALLLTAKFDFGKTRRHLFADCPRFFGKLALLDRISFFDGKTGTEDHAWYIWTKEEHETKRMFWEGKKP